MILEVGQLPGRITIRMNLHEFSVGTCRCAVDPAARLVQSSQAAAVGRQSTNRLLHRRVATKLGRDEFSFELVAVFVVEETMDWQRCLSVGDGGRLGQRGLAPGNRCWSSDVVPNLLGLRGL